VQLGRKLLDTGLGLSQRLCGGRDRIGAGIQRLELCARLGRAREQLLVGLAAKAPARGSDPVELGLDVLQAVRLRFEGREERAQLGGGLAQAQLDVAELVPGALELGRQALQRGDCALGGRREPGCAVAVLGGKGLACGGDALRELRHAAQPLTLGAQLVLGGGLESLRVLDERP
jgi:hypothetical protein